MRETRGRSPSSGKPDEKLPRSLIVCQIISTEVRQIISQATRIKQISPVSWKHVNFYGRYIFRDDGEVVDLDQMVSQLVAIQWEGADPKQSNRLTALRQN